MKMSQIDTENDKNLKTFKISKILCIVFQIFDGLFDWNVEMGKQGKNVLSTSIS